MNLDTSTLINPTGPVLTVSTFTPINTDMDVAEIKVENDQSNNVLPGAAEEPQPTSAPATATPRKRGRKKAAEGHADADADSTETPTKKGKTSPKKGLGPIPASLESAGLADKMVLRMRDEEGRSWSEITSVWTKMTGIKVEGSTLRKRYTAMKANFVSISAEDEARILKVKKEVEEKFEQEKWHKIAEGVAADGGNSYPANAIQKKCKELNKRAQAAAVVETED
ncbi:hypothetical protein CNMCM8927_004958 [Aspergillus lentulus]|uniref:Myb-like domain-containing protein n=1 Tax=Aspergillus lentulus TaxID=293939 RepID=A0AAN6BTU1_ASPLE|nr:hypothetical protein CNMCM8060_003371 [Aspergillus lentulus]KAF4188880.1 hypothetical protein CNMCM7927_000454 [Aspergillus lentulus]KAF4196433.1 hypothetical protein CNMCM8694_004985 [Aspergillus lentulus]KAF4209755.1 hypothetical protein CNMCM8927_004958 [Aspergillus lentulus]